METCNEKSASPFLQSLKDWKFKKNGIEKDFKFKSFS